MNAIAHPLMISIYLLAKYQMIIMIIAAILLQKNIGNNATLQLMNYIGELYILFDLYYSKYSALPYFSECPCITILFEASAI